MAILKRATSVGGAYLRCGLRHPGKQRNGLLVDVDDPDFAHAALDELWMHISEHPEIQDAAIAHLVEQPLDAGEILDPQRHR